MYYTGKIIGLFIILFITSLGIYGQDGHDHDHATGHVYERDAEGNLEPLTGVNVYWSATTLGTITDEKGFFHIEKPHGKEAPLVISYIGYKNDTVLVREKDKNLEITLSVNNELQEVVITNKALGGHISRLNPIHTFNITSAELTKAACCNLSESFQTSASVDVAYDDAVTGAKQIRLLGLAGKYSLIQTENVPSIRGLALAYGLNYIPGSWMESIQVSKGTASVKNGYESITGQINVEQKKPDGQEKLFFNGYANMHGRLEGNFNSSIKLNDRWSTAVLGHVQNMSNKTDNNGDGFLDQPLVELYALMNRWKYDNKKNLHAQFGIKALYEDRQGGQVDYNSAEKTVSPVHYGIGVETRRLEAFSKTAYIFQSRPGTNIAFINSFIHHDLNSFYGLNDYDARENNYYGNLMFQTYIDNTQHLVTTGVSYVYDGYHESLNDSLFIRKESTPGIFAEYTFIPSDKFTLLLGIRADHSNIHGTFFTPRLHAKYGLNEKTIFRLSAGKGYRTPNVIAENTSLLATSRMLRIRGDIRMEEAWNYGINLTRYFDILGRELTLNLEFYRTDFINQAIVDMDFDTRQVLVYNLDGRSYSNTYQVEAMYELINRLDLTLAFRYNDVKQTTDNVLQQAPLVNRYKGLLGLSYATNLKKWQFDLTTQLNGDSRIPTTASNPVEYQRGTKSPVYAILNAQVTKFFRRFEVYVGGENLTNYKQKNPIIASDDPFGPYFDSSLIWGPVDGIKVYAGFRYILKY
jgi:outer membrane receptor for ferrienterochelin and colicin